MKGYWLMLRTEIADQKAPEECGKLWAPIAGNFGARLNPTKVTPILKETRGARVVIVEFPSLEQAKACYDDPAYPEAMRFAPQMSKRELLVFRGLAALKAVRIE